MRKRKRKKDRKNYFSTFILTAILWLLVGIIVYFTDPQTPFVVLAFFFLFFFALLFTLSTILSNTKRGFIISLALVIFLILRTLGVGNLLNLLLLSGFVIAFDYYLT